ncbi:hypothetical protein ACJX0J_009638 [Zea mays]
MHIVAIVEDVPVFVLLKILRTHLGRVGKTPPPRRGLQDLANYLPWQFLNESGYLWQAILTELGARLYACTDLLIENIEWDLKYSIPLCGFIGKVLHHGIKILKEDWEARHIFMTDCEL